MTTEIDKNLIHCRKCDAPLARLVRGGQAIAFGSSALLYHPVRLFCRKCDRSNFWQPSQVSDLLTPEQKKERERIQFLLGKE
jgi:uncharacterized protein with PIN domain